MKTAQPVSFLQKPQDGWPRFRILAEADSDEHSGFWTADVGQIRLRLENLSFHVEPSLPLVATKIIEEWVLSGAHVISEDTDCPHVNFLVMGLLAADLRCHEGWCAALLTVLFLRLGLHR